ncbi:hypothetical protein DS893_00725 [Vibrionales bacterium C3R12]|nr:hypothetical protein DS893_00725 [Vibrionales bacterium C3R12]
MNSYNELAQILDRLSFSDFYFNQISNAYCQVDFGKRKGKIDFTSIKSAAEQYTYESSGKYSVSIDRQLGTLEETQNAELILQCVEVFDWGGVQASNIIDAINLHRKNELKPYLAECKVWFENDDDLIVALDKLSWSSGWTKVFSFMFELTTIYDSRVAAYINYIFASFFDSLQGLEQKSELTMITKHLVSFKGSGTRVRCLNSELRGMLGVKMKSSDDKRNFKANKVASWFLRYLSKLEYGEVTQANFRKMDKAMFMLGFDIKQIDLRAPFE